MPEVRRRFSPQFKAEAVQMVLETGRSIAEFARDLGIHDGTLGDRGELEAVDRATLVERMRHGSVLVLDVRPVAEYAAGHIAGARSVPVDELHRRLRCLPDDTEIVAYCRGPGRQHLRRQRPLRQVTQPVSARHGARGHGPPGASDLWPAGEETVTLQVWMPGLGALAHPHAAARAARLPTTRPGRRSVYSAEAGSTAGS
jgi:transposase-like protein